jgi:hypothetical protein
MMWTNAEKTGDLMHGGEKIDTGYSGCDQGKNNPDMQAVFDVGPIPQGDWTISGLPVNTAEHGPFVLTLTPANGTAAFGSSGFLIHGHKIGAPGTASKGCNILARTIREQIWNSGDTDLEVVPEFAAQDLQGTSA